MSQQILSTNFCQYNFVNKFLACIEANPLDRVTVSQLLENDFFEEKYLNVLVVGTQPNSQPLELKLRLVVNETGTTRPGGKGMPEDEAIDFTFQVGRDIALNVAQDMAKESTLNHCDIPLVARAIHSTVSNYMKTKPPNPNPQPTEKKIEKEESSKNLINIIKPTASKENQPEGLQKEEVKLPEENKEEQENQILKKSGSEESKIAPDQPKLVEKPKSTEPVEEPKQKVAPAETKTVGEKNPKKKKSNNKRKW